MKLSVIGSTRDLIRIFLIDFFFVEDDFYFYFYFYFFVSPTFGIGRRKDKEPSAFVIFLLQKGKAIYRALSYVLYIYIIFRAACYLTSHFRLESHNNNLHKILATPSFYYTYKQIRVSFVTTIHTRSTALGEGSSNGILTLPPISISLNKWHQVYRGRRKVYWCMQEPTPLLLFSLSSSYR